MSKYLFLTLALLTNYSCVPKDLNEIKQEVAKDSIAQYELSSKSGDQVETCVKAQLVAEAFNQANDESNYLIWKSVQSCECLKSKYPNDKETNKRNCKIY